MQTGVKKLVIARLHTMPLSMSLSIGTCGVFGKNELIMHVEKEDAIGKKIVEMHLNYLRSVANQ